MLALAIEFSRSMVANARPFRGVVVRVLRLAPSGLNSVPHRLRQPAARIPPPKGLVLAPADWSAGGITSDSTRARTRSAYRIPTPAVIPNEPGKCQGSLERR